MDEKPQLIMTVTAAEQQLLNYLMVYKKCKTDAERQEVQHIILAWEAWIESLRKDTNSPV